MEGLQSACFPVGIIGRRPGGGQIAETAGGRWCKHCAAAKHGAATHVTRNERTSTRRIDCESPRRFRKPDRLSTPARQNRPDAWRHFPYARHGRSAVGPAGRYFGGLDCKAPPTAPIVREGARATSLPWWGEFRALGWAGLDGPGIQNCRRVGGLPRGVGPGVFVSACAAVSGGVARGEATDRPARAMRGRPGHGVAAAIARCRDSRGRAAGHGSRAPSGGSGLGRIVSSGRIACGRPARAAASRPGESRNAAARFDGIPTGRDRSGCGATARDSSRPGSVARPQSRPVTATPHRGRRQSGRPGPALPGLRRSGSRNLSDQPPEAGQSRHVAHRPGTAAAAAQRGRRSG